jgi:hypothetical protein
MSGTGKEYGELMRELRKRKEPLRIEYALRKITELGYSCNLEEGNKCVQFTYKGGLVRFFPHTGWATGKTIKDGRGINKLIKQIKP